jgi:hypothetical protein
MTPQPDDPCKQKVKFLQAMSKIQNARLMLRVYLASFGIGFLAFLASVFILEHAASQYILGGIDFLLALKLNHIAKHLYPVRSDPWYVRAIKAWRCQR